MKRKLYTSYTKLSVLVAMLLLVLFAGTANGQIISQYVETESGSAPKGIEVWNNTSATLDFATNNLVVKQRTNATYQLVTVVTVSAGTLAPNAVMAIGTADIGTYLTGQGLTAVTYISFNFAFNGDDALTLEYGGVTTDIFGDPGLRPVPSWSGNGVNTANQNIQLLPGITTGSLVPWTDPSLRFQTVSTTPSIQPAGLAGFGIAPFQGPTLTVSPAVLNGFSYNINEGPSTSKTYSLSGALLTPAAGDITVSGSTNYEISLDNSTFSATPLNIAYTANTLASTTVYVRLKAGLAAGTYNGELISNAGGGATTANVTCNGLVANPATHLAFNNFPATGFLNMSVGSFKVQALNINELVDPGYTGAITLAKVSGPGDVAGTLTQTAVAGEATFNDISFTATGTYVLQATATGLTSANSTAIVISLPPSVTADIIPLYMSGNTPSNNRIPLAFRATLQNLLPNTTYRYINTADTVNGSPTNNGAGVVIYINADGTFTRTTSVGFSTPGQYGEFTTNTSGSFTGWFMLEPTNNGRFAPGKQALMRFRLNDGAGGTTAVHYLTIPESITVLQFSTGATAFDGTSVRATSLASSKNFSILYDNTAATGRPLYATSIETTGIDFTAISQYTAFYKDFVSGHNGAWGAIIPNLNANGVQCIQERSLTTGALVSQEISANGVWGLTDTRNPVYGIDSVLVLHLAPEMVAETVPAYMQGINGTNNQRLPLAYHATISYLKPGAVYRYYNKAVLATDDITVDGAGNTILVNSDGSFTHTTASSMGTAGQYGEFTADAEGNYSGWFMIESTGDNKFTPGNDLHMRIMLNDGANGTNVAVRLTTESMANVITFGAAYNELTGTGIRGLSLATPGNMVYIYGNETGEGQPLYASSIETTGLDYASFNNYADYYLNEVAGTNGSWGGIVPNVMPDGVRRIEERSTEDGTLVNLWTSPNGVWGIVDTRNPLGGEETELVIDLMPTGEPTLTAIPSTLTGFTYIEFSGPSASQSYTLSGSDLEGAGNIAIVAPADYEISLDNITFTASLDVPFADGVITGQPVAVHVRLNAGLAMGEYNLEVITNNGGGAAEKTVTASGSVTTSALPGITALILPEYMEGLNGTNITRIPFAYHATFSYLLPEATYRYYNKVVVESDLPDFNGAGNTIFVNEDGTFTRTTTTSLDTPGQYGEFTTDAAGSWSGWFVTEPSGNDRFTPGNHLYMRIVLNDGNGGTEVATRFTTEQYARVLQFGIEALPTHGTAIEAISNDMPGDFVFLYNGTSDTLRPIYGTHIESTGIDFCATTVYAPFYCESVTGVAGSWGGIVPNVNANGVQMIQVRSNADGSVLHTYTDSDAVWSTTDTRNPSGGVDSVLFIDLKNISVGNIQTDLARIWSRGNEIVIEPKTNASYQFSIFNISGKQVASYSLNGIQEIGVNLPAGVYVGRLQNEKGVHSVKLFIK